MDDYDLTELGLGVLLAGAGAGVLSTLVPTPYALAAGLAVGLPFLAVGAGVADDDLDTRVLAATAAFGAGILTATAALAVSLPATAQTPVVIGATYAAGSLVAVTR